MEVASGKRDRMAVFLLLRLCPLLVSCGFITRHRRRCVMSATLAAVRVVISTARERSVHGCGASGAKPSGAAIVDAPEAPLVLGEQTGRVASVSTATAKASSISCCTPRASARRSAAFGADIRLQRSYSLIPHRHRRGNREQELLRDMRRQRSKSCDCWRRPQWQIRRVHCKRITIICAASPGDAPRPGGRVREEENSNQY
jgi:hypothetical protein